jgi:hypothetical protein
MGHLRIAETGAPDPEHAHREWGSREAVPYTTAETKSWVDYVERTKIATAIRETQVGRTAAIAELDLGGEEMSDGQGS